MKKLISSVVIAGAVMGGNVYAQSADSFGFTGRLNPDGSDAVNTINQPRVVGIKTSNNPGTNPQGEVKNEKDGYLTTQGYVDQQMNGLQNRVSEVERNSYAGIAGVAAISQIQVAPGKDFAIGVGVGTYRGQSTAAVGAAARINENLHFRAGFSGSGVAAAGLTFSW